MNRDEGCGMRLTNFGQAMAEVYPGRPGEQICAQMYETINCYLIGERSDPHLIRLKGGFVHGAF